MRSLAPLLLLAVLTLPFASAALVVDAPPVPKSGDYQVLHGTVEIPGTGSGTIDTTTTYAGTESVTVGGHAYDAVKAASHTVSNFTGSAGGQPISQSATSDTTAWTRVDDFASLKSVSTSRGQTTTTEYNPPCATFQYPMSVGKTWTVDCTITTTSPSGQQQTKTTHGVYTVAREEKITVAAGTFDALVIEATTNNVTLNSWYAPDACGFVKAESPNPQGGSTVTLELQGYKCNGASGGASGSTPAGTTPSGSTPASGTSGGATTPASSTPAKAPGFGFGLLVIGAVIVAIALRRR
ncbi:MAG: hypothetical protein QOE90_3117 [Thermoplasmata archaeon]|jgi:hypothetical protein|nr:hypothetical protein [Thermoplasmata archaeon]